MGTSTIRYRARMETLIAEDVLLLLLDDDTGRFIGSHRNVVIGSALLVELGLLGALALGGQRTSRAGRTIEVVSGSVMTDDILARALEFVATHPAGAQQLIKKLGEELRPSVLARMVEGGWVSAERGKVLGIFTTERYPARDESREHAVRAQVSDALVGGHDPDDRTAAVIAIFGLCRVTPYLIDRQGVSRRVINKRVSQSVEGDWASGVVREVIGTAWTMTAPSAGSGGTF